MKAPGCALVLLSACALVACPEDSSQPDGGSAPQKTLTVAVSKAGDGLGAVVSQPEGIDCGSDCTTQEHEFVIGGNVALVATPARDALFGGWVCADENGSTFGDQDASIVATTPDDEEGSRTTCTPTFRQLYTLLVIFAGQGEGRVTGSLLRGNGMPRIDCASDGSGDCTAGYFAGEVETLTATADGGSTFSSWALDCGAGTAPATVTMDENKNCEARFD